jgi:hypothetical protein
MAIAFGELVDKLLHAGRGLGHDVFFFALSQRYLFVERTFEQRFEIGCD